MILYFTLIDVPIYFLDKNQSPEFIEYNIIQLEKKISYFHIQAKNGPENLLDKVFFSKKKFINPPKHSIFDLGANSPQKTLSFDFSHPKKYIKQRNYANKSIKRTFGDLLRNTRTKFQKKLSQLELIRANSGVSYLEQSPGLQRSDLSEYSLRSETD